MKNYILIILLLVYLLFFLFFGMYLVHIMEEDMISEEYGAILAEGVCKQADAGDYINSTRYENDNTYVTCENKTIRVK